MTARATLYLKIEATTNLEIEPDQKSDDGEQTKDWGGEYIKKEGWIRWKERDGDEVRRQAARTTKEQAQACADNRR